MDKPHWHEDNPWKDHVVYVPIEELADACALTNRQVRDHKGEISTWTKGDVLDHWDEYGSLLDPYILTGNKILTAGIRYGANPEDYLSPGFVTAKLQDLLRKYREVI